jgi:hypothetical protein
MVLFGPRIHPPLPYLGLEYIYIYILRIFFLFFVWKFKYEGIGRNGKIILLFGSLSEMNEIEHSFLPIPSKPQFSFPPKLGGIREN